MTQQTYSAKDDALLSDQIHKYIDRIIVPDRFRYCCNRWFDDHRRRYEVAGHGFSEVSTLPGPIVFDHVYRSGKRMFFLKIWSDICGRHGSADFKVLEDYSSAVNLFYDNDLFLFSIHRFRDSMWEISKKYDNVHLVESRFLNFD